MIEISISASEHPNISLHHLPACSGASLGVQQVAGMGLRQALALSHITQTEAEILALMQVVATFPPLYMWPRFLPAHWCCSQCFGNSHVGPTMSCPWESGSQPLPSWETQGTSKSCGQLGCCPQIENIFDWCHHQPIENQTLGPSYVLLHNREDPAPNYPTAH